MTLTPRRRRVLELVCGGYTDKQIAARMGIGVQGTKNHLTAIYRHYGVTRRHPDQPGNPRIRAALAFRAEEER